MARNFFTDDIDRPRNNQPMLRIILYIYLPREHNTFSIPIYNYRWKWRK